MRKTLSDFPVIFDYDGISIQSDGNGGYWLNGMFTVNPLNLLTPELAEIMKQFGNDPSFLIKWEALRQEIQDGKTFRQTTEGVY